MATTTKAPVTGVQMLDLDAIDTDHNVRQGLVAEEVACAGLRIRERDLDRLHDRVRGFAAQQRVIPRNEVGTQQLLLEVSGKCVRGELQDAVLADVMSETMNYLSCGDFRPGQGRDRIGLKMKMRPAVFGVLFTVAALIAMAAKPASTTAKVTSPKPPHVIDLDWRELAPAQDPVVGDDGFSAVDLLVCGLPAPEVLAE